MKAILIGLTLISAVVIHADEAVYLMRGPILPSAHEANGYALAVRDRADGSVEVHVETSLNPIGSRGSFTEVRSGVVPSVPNGFELPSRLRSTLRPEMDAWEAATTVLEWVSGHLALVDPERTLGEIFAARTPLYAMAELRVPTRPNYSISEMTDAVLEALCGRPDIVTDLEKNA